MTNFPGKGPHIKEITYNTIVGRPLITGKKDSFTSSFLEILRKF